jgi:hypothetical protein
MAKLRSEQILPLLDGLDEVPGQLREECVKAINAFRAQHGLVPMVVCSRTAEHAEATERLRLLAAVEIQPLTGELGVVVAEEELGGRPSIVEVHRGVRACWVTHAEWGVAVTPARTTRLVLRWMKNSTYRVLSQIVSTVKQVAGNDRLGL